MADKSYSEKLRDPRWQKKRLEILSRDEFTCQRCFDTSSTLVVHHRSYLAGREPWDYSNEYLVTLCELCHSEEHDLEGVGKDLVNIIKMKGFFNSEIQVMAENINGANWLTASEWMYHGIDFIHKREKQFRSFLKEKAKKMEKNAS